MQRIRVMTLAAVLGLVATATAASCSHSSAHELCDAICECEKCSDRKADDCVLEEGARQDVANAYGCDPERIDLDECLLRAGECTDANWHYPGNDCVNERQDLCDCIDAKSDYPDALLGLYGC